MNKKFHLSYLKDMIMQIEQKHNSEVYVELHLRDKDYNQDFYFDFTGDFFNKDGNIVHIKIEEKADGEVL